MEIRRPSEHTKRDEEQDAEGKGKGGRERNLVVDIHDEEVDSSEHAEFF